MSKELNQYLRSVPVYQFRLVDGTTILAKLIDIDDSNNVHLEDPHEVHLEPSNDIFDVANLQTKDLYTKAILQTRIRDMIGEFKRDHVVDTSDMFKSFIDGLDSLDSRPKFGKRPWPPEEDI